ncbi:MAG: GNAT family N-acetyltransferase [Pseudomonadales bacterium]|nr:GNAT family N-acetyltransferase [Pseudomonadales bacterium]
MNDGSDGAVFGQILDSQWLDIFVLVGCDGQLISSCYLNIIPNLTRSASPYAVIENVITDRAERGKGYAQRVMTDALNHCWSAGCYKAMLLTGSSTESTHAFYRACGFTGGEKIGYIARPAQPSFT